MAGERGVEVDTHFCYSFKMIHSSCGTGIVKYGRDALILTGVRRIVPYESEDREEQWKEGKEKGEEEEEKEEEEVPLLEVDHAVFGRMYEWETVREYVGVRTKRSRCRSKMETRSGRGAEVRRSVAGQRGAGACGKRYALWRNLAGAEPLARIVAAGGSGDVA